MKMLETRTTLPLLMTPSALLLMLAMDPSASAQTWYPADGSAVLLTYEDQWPYVTDHDYNDVVLQVNWRFDRNTAQPSGAFGFPVLRALLTVDPVALGGVHDNGLGLQLPAGVSSEGMLVQRRVNGGAWTDVSLESFSEPTVVLSSNLRELFGMERGQLNVGVAGGDGRTGQRLEVELNWPVGADLDTSAAPFDLYIFRSADPTHEIHFPWYGGTASRNVALFALAGAANGAGRWYVNARGVPAALNLQTASVYPTEATPLDAVFPSVLNFAQLATVDAPWTGPANSNPKTFYERPEGAGARMTRTSPAARPAPPDIARVDCSLSGNRVGKRVRAGLACVASGCASGFALQGGTCVSSGPNGSSQALAAQSCNAIKATNASATSGAYWIDPNGGSTADAYQVFCDMQSDGGGWTLVMNYLASVPPSSIGSQLTTGFLAPTDTAQAIGGVSTEIRFHCQRSDNGAVIDIATSNSSWTSRSYALGDGCAAGFNWTPATSFRNLPANTYTPRAPYTQSCCCRDSFRLAFLPIGIHLGDWFPADQFWGWSYSYCAGGTSPFMRIYYR
jgi:LruC domain-containing protein